MLVGKQKIPEKPAISNLVKEVLVQVEKINIWKQQNAPQKNSL